MKKNEIKIKFPQKNYPFKIICDNNTQIINTIVSILHKHDTFSGKQKYSSNISKESKYISYTFELNIKSQKILSEIFKEIKKINGVIMCL